IFQLNAIDSRSWHRLVSFRCEAEYKRIIGATDVKEAGYAAALRHPVFRRNDPRVHRNAGRESCAARLAAATAHRQDRDGRTVLLALARPAARRAQSARAGGYAAG